MEKENRIDNLINNWMSTHYEYETLMKTIKEMDKKSHFFSEKKKEQSKDVTTSEWKRLAGFMKQRK